MKKILLCLFILSFGIDSIAQCDGTFVVTVISTECDPNGTYTDPSDDKYRVIFTVSKNPLSGDKHFTVSGGITMGNTLINNTGGWNYSPYIPISGGGVTFTVTQVGNPQCTQTVTATPPATCSSCNNILAFANGQKPLQMCEGAPLNLTSPDVYGQSWTGPNGFSKPYGSNDPQVSTSATTSHSGTYTVNGNRFGCPFATATVQVTVFQKPQIYSFTQQSVCIGNNFSFPSPSTNLSWSDTPSYYWTGPNGFSSSNANPTIPNFGSSNGGIYTVEVTNGICTATNTMSIQVLTPPVISSVVASSSPANPITAGNAVNLSATVTGTGTYGYVWAGPNGYTSNSQNPVISSTNNTHNGVYTVSITPCVTATATVSIQIIARDLKLTKTSNKTKAYIGENVIYTISVINEGGLDATGVEVKDYLPTGMTYSSHNTATGTASNNTGIITWDIGNVPIGATMTLTVTATVTTEGNWTNKAEISAMVGTDKDSTPNNYTTTPDEDDFARVGLSVPFLYCPTQAISITATAPNVIVGYLYWGFAAYPQYATYQWQKDGVNIPGATNLTYNITSPGVYSAARTDATAAASGNAGCYMSCSPIIVESVSTSSIITTASPSPVCTGNTANLSVTSGTAYSWSGPDNFSSNIQNPAINNVTAAANGIYSVTLTVGGCSVSSTVSLTVSVCTTSCTPFSIITATATPNTFATGGTSMLNVTGGGITAGTTTFSWSGSVGTPTFTSNIQSPSTNAISTSGGYSYTVTVNNSGTCTATATTSLTVSTAATPCSPLSIISATATPNTFAVGGTSTLNVTGGGITAGTTTFSWTGSAGTPTFSSNVQSPNTNAISTSGGYSYTVTATNADGTGICTATATTSLTVSTAATPCSPLSIISATATPNSFSTGGSSILNVTGGGITAGSTTFSWSGSAGTPTFSSNIQSPNTNAISTSGGYTYTVTATNANGTGICTAIAITSLTVSVIPTCSISIVSAIPSACDKWSNTYDVAVTVNYSMNIQNNITINGTSFTPTSLSGTQTFNIGRFVSNGYTNLDVTASIAGSGTCTNSKTYNAPAQCNNGLPPIDPIGYAYCQQTGQIIMGGTISVTGPAGAVITIVENGSTGRYSWITNGIAGIYTMAYTPPAGYSLSTTCLPQPAALDPTGQPDPYYVGSNVTGQQLNTYSCAANPFYTRFDLQPGDPIIDLNNFPLNCSCPSATLTSFQVTCNGNIANNDAKLNLSNLINATHFGYSTGNTYTGPTIAGASTIPASGDILTNIANPAAITQYTVRVFNNNECFQDYTVTLQPKICVCPPANCLQMTANRIR